MNKTFIFRVVFGIAAYIWVTNIVDRISESKDKSIFNVVDVVKETNQFVKNSWVAKVIQRPTHYLFCHVQIMETLHIYDYTMYWLVHKIAAMCFMYAKGWSHITTVQTGVIMCMITFFMVCISFDIEFDIRQMDVNMKFMRYIAVESILNIALIVGTQFLPAYQVDSFLSINLHNYVFFSNLSHTMLFLCVHCLGIILFDLYANDYISKIANVSEERNLLVQLQNNIKSTEASLNDMSEKYKELIIKNVTEHIRLDRHKFNAVQESLDDTIMHIRFMLVMCHLAIMFFLLSTYFTGPTSRVATQHAVSGKKFEKEFISDEDEKKAADEAAEAAQGAGAVGNNGVQNQVQQKRKRIKLWKVEPYHFLTCINITFMSSLAHMVLFVVTILISPRAHRFYIIPASVGTVFLKIYMHEKIPSSKGNVCHMDPKKIDITVPLEGQMTVGTLASVQIIIAVYFFFVY